MARDNAIAVNDDELGALQDARQEMYGTDEVPYGVVLTKLIEYYQQNGGEVANV